MVAVDFKRALNDFRRGWDQRPIWLALGWNDIQRRYNRSKLGAIWASLSILIFVAALGPIYAKLSGVEIRSYTLYLLLGFIVWNYLFGIITECGREFTNSANYLISFQLSYFSLLLRVVWRNLIVFGYQMIVFFVLAFIFRQPVSVWWLVSPLALILITINALWIGTIISVFATRFRDLAELLNNIMRLLFFVTPIIWVSRFDESLRWIVELNPFYHLIDIYRAPILYQEFHYVSWLVVLLMPVVGWVVAFTVFARFRTRLAFWL